MLIDKRIITNLVWSEDEYGWYWSATEINDDGKQTGRTGDYYDICYDESGDGSLYRLPKEDQEADINLLFEVRP